MFVFFLTIIKGVCFYGTIVTKMFFFYELKGIVSLATGKMNSSDYNI